MQFRSPPPAMKIGLSEEGRSISMVFCEERLPDRTLTPRMSNVLSEEKKQQVIALGKHGWPLH
jgi:hypothetical protein